VAVTATERRAVNGMDPAHALLALQVAEGYRPPLMPSLPPSVREAIEACWKGDASLRPSAGGVVEMLQKIQQSGKTGGDCTALLCIMITSSNSVYQQPCMRMHAGGTCVCWHGSGRDVHHTALPMHSVAQSARALSPSLSPYPHTHAHACMLTGPLSTANTAGDLEATGPGGSAGPQGGCACCAVM